MFSGMLSEIRAYGQGLLIVDQVPARLIPDAIKNTNLKIVHRLVARDDRDAMASCMALRLDQEDIIAELQRGEAIVCGDLDDASWVKVEEEPSR
jgi:DNA helicase HerA-like ATPase